MAKRLCGTAERLYQAGLLGLCSCIWRAASSPPTRIVSEILQRSSHPLGAEQGCTGSASSPSCWQHNCEAAPRWITPSIRSNLICGRDRRDPNPRRPRRRWLSQKSQAAFRWLGDQAEARRLQREQTYHYIKWTFLIAVAVVIAGLIALGLSLLR